MDKTDMKKIKNQCMLTEDTKIKETEVVRMNDFGIQCGPNRKRRLRG